MAGREISGLENTGELRDGLKGRILENSLGRLVYRIIFKI
jgi:hypothetical protein